MKSYFEFIKELAPYKKKTLLYLFLTYFLVLFSYPIIRSAVGAYFYEYYTSSEYSIATLIAIGFLVVCIYISNKLQKNIGIHQLYLSLCVATSIIFGLSFYFLNLGIKPAAFLIFSLKESYIVLLIHLCLAFANGFFNLIEIKKLLGPIGAIGSIGGILGGQFTAVLAKPLGTDVLYFISMGVIILAGVCFHRTKKYSFNTNSDKSPDTEIVEPLKSVRPVFKFVMLICLIVALSQWVIFIADLQFNMIFEKLVTSKDARTAYLGNIYSYINGLSLFIQFIIIPYLLSRVTNRFVFFSIPIIYSGLSFLTMGLGASSIILAGGAFVFMKASDYSIFSYSKEVLYHGLTNAQKYGAKYITDMFAYRLAKALIAGLMAFVAVERIEILNMFQVLFILVWIICVYILFKNQKEE